MRRREVLGSIVATASGSIPSWGNEYSPPAARTAHSPTSTRRPGDTEHEQPESGPDEIMRSVTVVDTDSLASTYDTSLDVALVESNITPDHTASIEIELTNLADGAQTYAFGPRPVFSTMSSSDDAWLLVSPNVDAEQTGDCWSYPKETAPSSATERTVDGRDSISARFDLVANSRYSSARCMPTGTCRFEDESSVQRGTGDYAAFEWGFTIRIEDA